jgi:hypothetical protein
MDASISYIRPVSKETFSSELSQLISKEHVGGVGVDRFEDLDAFILHNVFSSEECEVLRAKTEAMQYTFWNQGAPDKKDFRNVDTVEVNDPEFAEAIWKRIEHVVTKEVTIVEDEIRWERGLQGSWRAVGVNEHLLFARYGSGGHFSPHTDGYTIVDLNKRSLFSLLIYLNDCPTGGTTRMFVPDEHAAHVFHSDEGGRMRWAEEKMAALAPVRTGTALAFYQNIPHEGEPVGEGCSKYIIRTDIMFEVSARSECCEHFDYVMIKTIMRSQ